MEPCPPHLKVSIETIASHVVKQGKGLEDTLKAKHGTDPNFQFLFAGREGNNYYIQCIQKNSTGDGNNNNTNNIRKSLKRKRKSRFDLAAPLNAPPPPPPIPHHAPPAPPAHISLSRKPRFTEDDDEPRIARPEHTDIQKPVGRKPLFTEDDDEEEENILPPAKKKRVFTEDPNEEESVMANIDFITQHNKMLAQKYGKMEEEEARKNEDSNVMTDAELEALGLPTMSSLSSLKDQLETMKQYSGPNTPNSEETDHLSVPEAQAHWQNSSRFSSAPIASRKPQSSVDKMREYMQTLDGSQQRMVIPRPRDSRDAYSGRGRKRANRGFEERSLDGKNKGFHLLKQMGWDGAGGLGKREQGIVTPVQAVSQTNFNLDATYDDYRSKKSNDYLEARGRGKRGRGKPRKRDYGRYGKKKF